MFEVLILISLLLIQDEMNIKRENESKLTLSEEIYSMLDDLLGGEYLFTVNMQTKT